MLKPRKAKQNAKAAVEVLPAEISPIDGVQNIPGWQSAVEAIRTIGAALGSQAERASRKPQREPLPFELLIPAVPPRHAAKPRCCQY